MQPVDRVYSYDMEVCPDGTFDFLRVDDGLLDLWGYTLEELQAGRGADLVLPEDSERQTAIRRRLAAGESWTGRIRTTSRTGETHVFLVHHEVDSVRVGDRTVTRAIARDITDVARADVALHEREARLRLLSEHLPVLMWTTDGSLRVTWWSGEHPLQIDQPEGSDLQDRFRDADLADAAATASQRALLGELVTFDHGSSGSHFRFSIESFVDEVGEIAGTIGVGVNLTEVPLSSQPFGSRLTDAVRDAAQSEADLHPEAVAVGELWIDPEGYLVRKRGQEISLTITEFKLLLEFARRPGSVLSHEVLAGRVWGYDFITSQSNIPMAIKRLRAKIEDDPADPRLIETVRGIGYRLRVPDAQRTSSPAPGSAR